MGEEKRLGNDLIKTKGKRGESAAVRTGRRGCCAGRQQVDSKA